MRKRMRWISIVATASSKRVRRSWTPALRTALCGGIFRRGGGDETLDDARRFEQRFQFMARGRLAQRFLESVAVRHPLVHFHPGLRIVAALQQSSGNAGGVM